MLLQTNSYIVPKEKRAEHSRLIRRFRQTLLRLGCDHFEVYEQVGSNWSNSESAGRYVQILRFLDRKHQLAVQSAERSDPTAQAVIADFCDLINFPYQQQQGLFAVGFYTSVLPVAPKRGSRGELVSTVEHEVVDDPEAEMPYPGASDGPPLEEAVAEDEPVEGEPHEPIVAETANTNSEFEPLKLADKDEIFDELLEESVEAIEPVEILAASPESAPVAPVAELSEDAELHLPEHSNDDFMKLVGGELDDESEEDPANGFIVEELSEETESPAHTNGLNGIGHEDILTDIEPEPVHKRESNDLPPAW